MGSNSKVPTSVLPKDNESNNQTITSQLLDASSWAWARVPNAEETFYNSLPVAVINVLFEEQINTLGDNPTARGVIRDGLKVPGNIISASRNAEVGGTGVLYDEGNSYGGVGKTLCKGLIIGSGALLDAANVKTYSRSSNYVCEIIPRSTAIISKMRQETNSTDISYKDYYSNNLNSSVITEAAFTSFSKSIVSDQTGEILGNFKPWFFSGMNIFKLIKAPALYVENAFLSGFQHIQADAVIGKSFYSKASLVYNTPNTNFLMKLLLTSSFFALKAATYTAVEMLTSFILSPLTRMAQDSTSVIIDKVNKGYHHIFEKLNPKIEVVEQKAFFKASHELSQSAEPSAAITHETSNDDHNFNGDPLVEPHTPKSEL